jgi:hypothetical protein
MIAILDGPFIDDWELSIRGGFDRAELRSLISRWRDVCIIRDDEDLIVNNCLNEICHGLPLTEAEWKEWIGYPKEEVCSVLEKWISVTSRSNGSE